LAEAWAITGSTQPTEKSGPGCAVHARARGARRDQAKRLCTTLKANCSACAMPPIVVEPVVSIFPPGKPLVVGETLRASEESLSPTAPVCLAR
jgi:hypothetical protein